MKVVLVLIGLIIIHDIYATVYNHLQKKRFKKELQKKFKEHGIACE